MHCYTRGNYNIGTWQSSRLLLSWKSAIFLQKQNCCFYFMAIYKFEWQCFSLSPPVLRFHGIFLFWDHLINKTLANFHDFWPIPPYHRHSSKMLMKGIFAPYVLWPFGHRHMGTLLPHKICWRLKFVEDLDSNFCPKLLNLQLMLTKIVVSLFNGQI